MQSTKQPDSSTKNGDYRVTVRSASISGGGIVVVQEKRVQAPEITYLSKTPTSGGGVVIIQNDPPSTPSTVPAPMRTSGGGIVVQPSSTTSPAKMHALRSNAFHGGCLVRVSTPPEATTRGVEIDLARMGIDFQRIMSLQQSKVKYEE